MGEVIDVTHVITRQVVAIAAIPSFLPTNPMVSFVVALTPTCWGVMPRASEMFAFISARCGMIFGCSATSAESTFWIWALCSSASDRHFFRMSSEQMPSMLMSSGGK